MKIEIDFDDQELKEKIIERVSYKIIEEFKTQLRFDYSKEIKNKVSKWFDDWFKTSMDQIISNQTLDGISFIDLVKKKFLDKPAHQFTKKSYIEQKLEDYLNNEFDGRLNKILSDIDWSKEYTNVANSVYKGAISKVMDLAKKSLEKIEK